MKSVVLSLLLAFSISTFTTQKSEAALGIMSGNPALALSGIGVTATGFGLSVLASDGGVMFLLGIAWGAIMLDGEGNQEIQFHAISTEDAYEAGLSPAEEQAFNENLAEINLVANEVSLELDQESTVEESRNLWADYSQMLDPVAYSALVKLAE